MATSEGTGQVTQEAIEHALDAIAHGQGYGPGERRRYRNDDTLMIEQVYGPIREAVLAGAAKAAHDLPRWTGAYIAEHERDGQYIEAHLVEAALATLKEGPTGKCPTCGSDDPALAFDPIRPEQPRRPLIWRDSIDGANYWCPDHFHESAWEKGPTETPLSHDGRDADERTTVSAERLQAFLAIFDRRMVAGEFVGDEELIDARHELFEGPTDGAGECEVCGWDIGELHAIDCEHSGLITAAACTEQVEGEAISDKLHGRIGDALMEEASVVAALDKFCFDGLGYSVATANRMREALNAALPPAVAAVNAATPEVEEGS